MAIDTELLRAKVREIDEAEKAARDFRAGVGARFKIVRKLPDSEAKIPGELSYDPATLDQLVTEVEASRALDTMVETRKAEFEAIVNGKPKRKRVKKAAEKKGDEKPVGKDVMAPTNGEAFASPEAQAVECGACGHTEFNHKGTPRARCIVRGCKCEGFAAPVRAEAPTAAEEAQAH